jgi:protein-export membrane protein SecD
MNNRILVKAGLILLVIITALVSLYPNFVWYSLPLAQRQEQAKRKNPLGDRVIPLGLDLQGGVRLVYQLDTSKLPDESEATVHQAVEQNIQVITNRIDALGVANAIVRRQGREFIVVELPGVFESEVARGIIGKTALLEFRIVKDNEALAKINEELIKTSVTKDDVAAGKLPADIQKLVPPGLQLMPLRDGGYLLVNATPDMTGKYLKEARVNLGGGGGMTVSGIGISFDLTPEGTNKFAVLTGAHINERLAIVLDNVIQSAPNIQSQIAGGSGVITGSFTAQEAKNLANILNSGNLQAPMSVVEERTVGPELGEDSIHNGFKSMLIGFILIVIFMLVYYKFSGFLANIALVINLVMLMAVMGWLHATMTMPGIAGILLSLAMAVDANVIILERVREELRKGKDAHTAIDEGYSKAFTAIFDGHVTAIVAAICLLQFGTGPVKGFGITLLFGLLISLVTAVWVTHVFYDVWFAIARPKTLSV